MSTRGPVAVFVATSVTLVAYLFPYFYLPGAWWRAIPSAVVILSVGVLYFGREMPRVYGLTMTWKELAISLALFGILLAVFSYALMTWIIVEPLSAEPHAYPPAQVHQLVQVFNDEVVLRAALLSILLRFVPYPRVLIVVTAALFAFAHHAVYQSSADIGWTAMVTIFSFGAIANTLFVRFGHIGYGFALHYAWNFFRFNTTYYLDGTRLSEGATFNYIEGNPLVTGSAIVVFVVVFGAQKTNDVARNS